MIISKFVTASREHLKMHDLEHLAGEKMYASNIRTDEKSGYTIAEYVMYKGDIIFRNVILNDNFYIRVE